MTTTTTTTPPDDTWTRLCWAALGYSPNPLQAQAIRAFWTGTRFILICGGERAGKSFTSVALSLSVMGPRDDGAEQLYWIVGPDYMQARAEFDYYLQVFRTLGCVAKESTPESHTLPWVLETDYGLRLETKTSSDIRKLASVPIDGAIMAEAAQQEYAVWLKLRGRVAQKRGWVVLSGTLEKGLPWYGTMLRKWKARNPDDGASFSLPSWSNTAIYPGGRDDPEIKALERSTPYDLFMERYGAEPHTQHGLVIPEFDPGVHLRPLELQRDPQTKEPYPLTLAIDPATHTYAVLFIQKIGVYAHVLDAVYRKNAVAQDVIGECVANPLWKYVNKRDGNVIDIAGTQRHANKSQVEIWADLAKVSLTSRFRHIENTIDVVRFRLGRTNTMGEPLLYFSDRLPNPEPLPDGSAAHFITEFELWKWPERSSNMGVARVPIDRANDGIKALGYWLLHHYGPVEKRKKKMVAAQPIWSNMR